MSPLDEHDEDIFIQNNTRCSPKKGTEACTFEKSTRLRLEMKARLKIHITPFEDLKERLNMQ